MAQLDLNTIKKIEKERKVIHDKVFTTYSIFEVDGNKYVQLDTYGKSDRKLPGKLSQSIQIDENSAKFLVDILKQEYSI